MFSLDALELGNLHRGPKKKIMQVFHHKMVNFNLSLDKGPSSAIA
jgi:hypothetical protein